jgi:hypothetical protein
MTKNKQNVSVKISKKNVMMMMMMMMMMIYYREQIKITKSILETIRALLL